MTPKAVRAVLPIEVYGDSEVRAGVATVLARELGDNFTVEHRNDQGIVIHLTWAATYPDQVASVSGIAALAAALETALERIAARGPRAGEFVKSLNKAAGRFEVKASPSTRKRKAHR